VGKSLPLLTNLERGRFSAIIFENFDKYLKMNKWNRELLDKYCREFNVGVIGIVQSNEEQRRGIHLNGLPITIDTGVSIKDFRLNPLSPVLRVTRAGEVHFGRIPGKDWVVFHSNHTSYQPLGQAFSQNEWHSNEIQRIDSKNTSFVKKKLLTTAIQV